MDQGSEGSRVSPDDLGESAGSRAEVPLRMSDQTQFPIGTDVLQPAINKVDSPSVWAAIAGKNDKPTP